MKNEGKKRGPIKIKIDKDKPKEESKEQPKQEPVIETPPTPEQTAEVTKNQMYDLLVALYQTPYWPAMKWYSTARCAYVDNSLRSIDPFKEPTKMAQNQGIRMGLLDLEGFVVEEIDRRKKENAKLQGGKSEEFGGQGY